MELYSLVLHLSIVFILSTKVTFGITVNINDNITGFAGSNGTFVECTYDKVGVVRYSYVNMYARRSNSFKQILEFDPDTHTTTIKDAYIKGRVSFNNITQDSRKVILSFDKLMCIDDTVYFCQVLFKSNVSNEPGNTNTSYIHIGVNVLPSMADCITISDIKNPEQSSSNASLRIFYETNKTMCSSRTHSEQPVKTGADQTILYNKILKEGDSVNIHCQGDIGNPVSDLTLQMIRQNNTCIQYSAVEKFTSNKSENCTFYQNSIFTVNLTAKDDGAFFRCVPISLHNDAHMYLETDHISVKYQVQNLVIKVYPKLEHATSQKTVTCSSNGNPSPDYVWYKVNDTTSPEQWEEFSFNQNITLSNMTDSGVYRCDANNTIAGKVYLKSANITITFTGTDKVTSPKTSTSGDSNGHATKNQNDKRLYYVIGGVVGGLLLIMIIILVGVVKCRIKSEPKTRTNNDKSDGPLVHQPSTKQSVGTDNYYSVPLDDNKDGQRSNTETIVSIQEQTRKHNEKYLKEHEEVNARNDAPGDHQPVEYAMVNKSLKGRSCKQQDDQHQPTEYAQVNKAQIKTSNEPPQDEDPYASAHGIYDHTKNRRHKVPTGSEPYDTSAYINKKRSVKVGSVVEITAEPTKQTQVAKVKPSGRAGYENAAVELDDAIKKKELNTEL